MRSSLSLLGTALVVVELIGTGPAAAMQAEAVPDRIAVVGEGSVETAPDSVEIELRVEQTADTVEAAKTVVDRGISRVLAACIGLGIDRASITATDLGVAPQYSYDAPGAAPKRDGFEVWRGVTVRLAKLEAFDDLLREAIRAGANEISSIKMKTSQERTIREQALARAIQDGKRQAEAIAHESGRQVDKVTSVATEDAQEWNGYRPGVQTVTVTASRAPAFLPGPITIHRRVFMTFSVR